MSEPANGSEALKVDVTIVKAVKLSELKTLHKKHRKFYITVTQEGSKGKNDKKTEAICSAGDSVAWNQKLENITIPLLSQIELSLYVKCQLHSDTLIGKVTISHVSIPETSFTIDSGGSTIVIAIQAHGGCGPNMPAAAPSNVRAQNSSSVAPKTRPRTLPTISDHDYGWSAQKGSAP